MMHASLLLFPLSLLLLPLYPVSHQQQGLIIGAGSCSGFLPLFPATVTVLEVKLWVSLKQLGSIVIVADFNNKVKLN